MISDLQQRTDPWATGVPWREWWVKYGHVVDNAGQVQTGPAKVEQVPVKAGKKKQKQDGGMLFDMGGDRA